MSDYGCCTLSKCVCPESAIGKCDECCYYDKNFFIEKMNKDSIEMEIDLLIDEAQKKYEEEK